MTTTDISTCPALRLKSNELFSVFINIDKSRPKSRSIRTQPKQSKPLIGDFKSSEGAKVGSLVQINGNAKFGEENEAVDRKIIISIERKIHGTAHVQNKVQVNIICIEIARR